MTEAGLTATLYVAQVALLLLAIPLLMGLAGRPGAWLAGRSGPGPLFPYVELVALARAEPPGHRAGAALRGGAAIAAVALLVLALAMVPGFQGASMFGAGADFITLACVLTLAGALATFPLALSDPGTPWGRIAAHDGLGAGLRAMPGLLLAGLALALLSGATHGGVMAAALRDLWAVDSMEAPVMPRAAHLLAIAAMVLHAAPQAEAVSRVAHTAPPRGDLDRVARAALSRPEVALTRLAETLRFTVATALLAGLFLPWRISLDLAAPSTVPAALGLYLAKFALCACLALGLGLGAARWLGPRAPRLLAVASGALAALALFLAALGGPIGGAG